MWFLPESAMSRLATILAASCLSVMHFAPVAGAEEVNPLVRERISVSNETRGGSVRVQTSINLFMPGPSGEGEAADQSRERARRMIYQLAARECGLLEDIIAKTCRLEAINVNLNRQQNVTGVAGEGYMVGGNITMMVTLK
jgi:hypothetical protein